MSTPLPLLLHNLPFSLPNTSVHGISSLIYSRNTSSGLHIALKVYLGWAIFQYIDTTRPNLRLGISADGVDVNTGNRHHSVWPVLIVIYNHPLWLCMKRKFINLLVLISGYLRNDIDVFLELLVDDVHTLFEIRVYTYDASTKDNFNLRAAVLWTINDYPALGTLCGCPYSGFKGCVVCGKDTNCVRLSASSKKSYALVPMTGEQIYNEVKHIENKWGKGKRTNNNASENQEDTRGRGGKIQKQKRNTTEEEGSSSHVNRQNEKNVAESIVTSLLHVPGKTKDGLNARLDLAELGVKPELFAMQDEDKTTLPPAGYTLTNAEKEIFCETLHNIKVPEGYCSNFSIMVNLKDRKLIGLKSHDYHMLMQEFLHIAMRSIMHPPTRYAIIRFFFFFKSICSKEIILQELDKMQAEQEGKTLSASKSSEVSVELFQKSHLYVIQNTDEIVPYIERHKQVLKTENPGKRIAFLENEHNKSFAKWLREEVERELAIDKESLSETVSLPDSGVSVEVLDYHFRQIPLFKCDWVNHKSGGVKRDKLGYTLVDLNYLGHKVDPFVLASQALQVFYVKELVDKKLSIVFKTPPKNYKDTYDEVDEEFSTVIHHRNDNVLPLVDLRDLANESQDDYYRKDCGENIVVNLDSSSDNNNSDSYSTSQISTSEEIDYNSPEPPKSLLKWYHCLSNKYKDNGRFWGSKSGCNESDVKPSWKDIEKAKACMLAKAQASEASSKAKVEAFGSKAKLQTSTNTLIVKSPGRGSLEVDKIIDISSDSSDNRRWVAKKVSAPVFYGPSIQGLLDAYGCDTIEEYLEWNYFLSTDNESTNMETTDKGNTDKDCIDDSNSAMSKGKYVPVCKKHNPNMYSHVPVIGFVLGLASVTTWDEI
ncbi:putative transposon, En/Spm-like protein [Tanacetum coccineum]